MRLQIGEDELYHIVLNEDGDELTFNTDLLHYSNRKPKIDTRSYGISTIGL